MNTVTLSQAYILRQMTAEDAPQILALYQTNPQYFDAMLSEPSTESVMHDLNALPVGMTAEAKHYLGVYDGSSLIAVLDLIDGYPVKGTAFIGLFMVNASVQGRGIGTRIVQECLKALSQEGYSEARLGFVEGNRQSEAFWLKNGFAPTGVRSRRDGYTIVIASRSLLKETDTMPEDARGVS
ncbi:MAG: GNAT family N-acetyltransferase [Clostridia bacterium]|nr:GNAT family N-acetyltransferase [Clostridia bacterium]